MQNIYVIFFVMFTAINSARQRFVYLLKGKHYIKPGWLKVKSNYELDLVTQLEEELFKLIVA